MGRNARDEREDTGSVRTGVASAPSAASGANRPIDVDQRLRDEAITLSRIQRLIPIHCLRPDDWRSWMALGRVLLTAVVCLTLLAGLPIGQGAQLLWQVPTLIALWILYSWVLVGLFVLGHDCGHLAFSRRRRVNVVVGHLCMAPLANTFHSWCVTHDHHHRHTQLRGQEVDWAAHLVTREELATLTDRGSRITRLGYSVPYGIFIWIVWNMLRRGFRLGEMLPADQLAPERRSLRLSALATLGILVAIYGALWYLGGVWAMLKYHGIPATLALFTGAVIITIQHANQGSLLYDDAGWTPVRGQLASTFDNRFPALLEHLWCNIGMHIPHHICPAVPWYHLPEAGAALRQAHPTLYQERRFSWRDLAWFARTPFLVWVPDKGYYTIETPQTAAG